MDRLFGSEGKVRWLRGQTVILMLDGIGKAWGKGGDRVKRGFIKIRVELMLARGQAD